MVKRVEKKVRVGLNSVDGKVKDAQEAGYKIVTKKSGKQYAISEIVFNQPETVQELEDLLRTKHKVETPEKAILEMVLDRYFKKYYRQDRDKAMRTRLNKEIPAEVKKYISHLKETIDFMDGISLDDIENIPFEYKQSKDTIKNYIAEIKDNK